jgi:hypothetical protein
MVKPGHRDFKSIKKYLTLRNLLILGLAVVIYLMFSNLAKAIFFIILSAPLCTLSIKVTRVIPNANVQIITPMTLFLSYLFGWPIGVFYGFILGLYFWSTAYSISQFVLLEVFLNAVVAFAADYMKVSLLIPFTYTYFICMAIQKVLYFTLGLAIGGNPVENTIHTVSSSITHFIIVPPFVFLLYNITSMI